jgi:phosphate:Na+ symporter
LFLVLKFAGQLLGLEDNPAVTLALFHTTFNILGVLLMWPVTERLARYLDKRFVTLEEVEGRPRYLDKTVAISPMLALNALALELSRIAAVVRRMALAALSAESGPGKRIGVDHGVVVKLSNAVADFISRLERGTLPGDIARQLAKLLRTDQHLLASADLALGVAKSQQKLESVDSVEVQECLDRYRLEVVQFVELTNFETEGFSILDCETQLNQVQTSYDEVKAVLLSAGVEKNTPVPALIDILEQNSRIRRMARQMMKATQHLNEVYTVTEVMIPQTASTNDSMGAFIGEKVSNQRSIV